MSHHRIQERSHIRFQMEGREHAQRISERVLQHVQRLFAIAREPKSEINDPSAMAVVQRGESAEFAGIGRLDELSVVAWIGV